MIFPVEKRMFFVFSLIGPYKTRTHLSYTILYLVYTAAGDDMTSVKRNGQAKEQLFSIWILDRLIDTEKERTRVKTITFS
jgi:hypothetical protein